MFRSLYTFQNEALLDEALTHKSCLNEQASISSESNERLEFLGDAALKAIHSRLLFEQHEDFDEGRLSKSRSQLEKNEQLALWTKHLGLDNEIRVGKSIAKQSRAWDKVCADVFEAYIGAVWKDSSFDFQLLYSLYHSFDLPIVKAETSNYKNQLQEYVQNMNRGCKGFDIRDCLCYNVVDISGPSHEPLFSVKCSVLVPVPIADCEGKKKSMELEQEVCRKLCSVAKGSSKKIAESEAARRMLDTLQCENCSYVASLCSEVQYS